MVERVTVRAVPPLRRRRQNLSKRLARPRSSGPSLSPSQQRPFTTVFSRRIHFICLDVVVPVRLPVPMAVFPDYKLLPDPSFALPPSLVPTDR